MMQIMKRVVFAALLVSAHVEAADYADAAIFAWKGTEADTDLWIHATTPGSSPDLEAKVKLLSADATFGTSPNVPALEAYGEDSSTGAAQKWTSTGAEPTPGTSPATQQIAFTAFEDSESPANASNRPATSVPILFHVSNVNFVSNFTDNANNLLDTVQFFGSSSLAQTKTCRIEQVSQRSANTTKYQLDFKVKCSGAALAQGDKFVISILKQPLAADALGASNANWTGLCESSEEITECTAIATNCVADHSGKIFYTFTFEASAAVSADTSHYLTIVGATEKTVPATAIIFSTALSGSTRTHFSYGTCTTASCAPPQSSSSRTVPLASVPVVAILVAAMLQ